MKSSKMICVAKIFLILIILNLASYPEAIAFQEGWDSSTIETYVPSSSLLTIPADEGDWILGDTVSEFPECGSTPNTAKILMSYDSQALRLTSNDSGSECADNIWVNIVEVPEINLNSGFSVPLSSETIISFDETGVLIDPEKGSSSCVSPPCGDTVSLVLEDSNGNILAYILQRAPDAVPNYSYSFYREIFLNPNGYVYSRNLFYDFSTIPDFNPNEATIQRIVFEVKEHGNATLDNICIGTSGCVVSLPLTTIPYVVGLTQDEAEAAIVAAKLGIGTITKQISETIPAGSVISQTPAAGIDVSFGTEVDLVVSKRALNIQEAKTLPYDGADSDSFGRSVSISGDYAIVGSPGDEDNGEGSGAAYIFEKSGANWSQVAKLTAIDGSTMDFFGWSVSISGDYAIVGAYGDDDNGDESGSAYIFERSNGSWNQVAKLPSSGLEAYDSFGCSVSISGDYAIVGANGDDDNGVGCGAAYIFKKSETNWIQLTKLTTDDVSYGSFGSSVSIRGDYVIVSAPNDDGHEVGSGAAYIFKKSNSSWEQVAKLIASDGENHDRFGSSVSISGDYAIVGARYNSGYVNSGAAYIFEKSGTNWSQVAKLFPRDGDGDDQFGCSVSIFGDYAIVGAYMIFGNLGSGAAYLFERNGTNWSQVATLTPSDGYFVDQFGYSVSIFGDYAIVGSPDDDDNGEESGSAYIFNLFSKNIVPIQAIQLLLLTD